MRAGGFPEVSPAGGATGFAVMDVETTGLFPSRGRVVEVAAVHLGIAAQTDAVAAAGCRLRAPLPRFVARERGSACARTEAANEHLELAGIESDGMASDLCARSLLRLGAEEVHDDRQCFRVGARWRQ